MNLGMKAGATPLDARQNAIVYVSLILGAVAIAVFFLVWFILKRLKDEKHTPEWIEAQKKRITRNSDIRELCGKYSVPKDEASLLKSICGRFKPLNILYLIRDTAAIDKLFKNAYEDMKKRNISEETITVLFRLRFRLERALASTSVISSTTALVENTQFNYISSTPELTRQISCTLLSNTAEGLMLLIPQTLYDSPDRPKELSKAAFTFSLKTGMHYVFFGRIIRYQISLDTNRPEMLVAHTNDLQPQTKRRSKREPFSVQSTMCAVKAVQEKNGAYSYTPQEHTYPCSFVNISADGCCITTNLPIKENQFLCVTLPFRDEGKKDPCVIGRIVATRKTDTSQFALHTQFVKIESGVRNRISAMIYDYV